MRNVALVVAAALLVTASPRLAHACGGFFCSQATPIDQTGEKILFTHDEAQNQVTYVQVQFQGRAEDFSWVLPVPGAPTVGIGSDLLFTALGAATNPSYSVNWQAEGTCTFPDFADGANGSGGASGGGGSGGGGGGGVEVIGQGQVGPYEWVILGASDPDELLAWLGDHDFDVTARGQELLRLYVDGEHNFVAVKLQQTSGVGDLVPIVLRYQEPLPCVPIRLTAVAAQPDMGVRAWVLANRRAVPLNYFHVKLNEARIDWVRGGQNYRDLVSEAVDNAPNGQGFITEYAGPSAMVLRDYSWLLDTSRYDLDRLRTLTDPYAYVQALMGQGFGGSSQLLAFLTRWVPLPAELAAEQVQPTDWYNCMECYDRYEVPFDPVAATADLDLRMVAPLDEARAILASQPYLTTLFTTLDPEEMTLDPYFTFNLELGDVSNQHRVDGFVECGDGGDWGSSPLRLALADGTVLRYDSFGSGAAYSRSEAGPAARNVEQLSDTGTGTMIEDFSAEISSSLQSATPTRGGIPGVTRDGVTTEDPASCGCGSGSGRLGGGLLFLAGLAGLAFLRRRPGR